MFIIRFVVVVVAGLALLLPGAAASEGRQDAGPRRAEGESSSLFEFAVVSAAWVAEHSNDADVRVLDVRRDSKLYLTGHVPRAVHFPAASLLGPERGVPGQLLPAKLQAQLFARAGVKTKSRVVIYGDGDEIFDAAAVAYCLERVGHTNVMLMDGGYSAFLAAHPVTQELPHYRIGYRPATLRRSIRVTLPELQESIDRPDVLVVDARSGSAFRGESVTWVRNGHMPGAVNLDCSMLLDPTDLHRFRSTSDTKAILAAFGVTRDRHLIITGGIRHEAALMYLYLRHVLGYPRVRVYEGSWTEYSARPELPVTTGAS